MKRTIEILLRLVAPPARLVALLLAVCAVGSAWAVTANVVWESDFKAGSDTRSGWNLNLDASWIDEDGNLTIPSGSTGAILTRANGYAQNYRSSISILIEYENAAAGTQGAMPFSLVGNDDANLIGIKTIGTSDLTMTGNFQDGTDYPKNKTGSEKVMTTMPASGALLFVIPNGACQAYAASSRAGLSASGVGSSIAGLSFTGAKYYKIALGGPTKACTNVRNFAGLKIKKVAIFTTAISASDAASYKFPSEADYTATISANANWEDISWENNAVWNDAADNSTKMVHLKIPTGVTLTKDRGLSASNVALSGGGTLAFTDSSGSGATVSAALGGDGFIRVASGTVTFAADNRGIGCGFSVANGGNAKASNSYGYGPQYTSCNISVESGGAMDVYNVAVGGYYITIAGRGIELPGGTYSGALYSSSDLGNGAAQLQGITLSGDATIRCDNTWGILPSGWNSYEGVISVGTHTLTKVGSESFWMCNVKESTTDTGTIKIAEGNITTVSKDNTLSKSTFEIANGATLNVNGSGLTIKTLTGHDGASIQVATGKSFVFTDCNLDGTVSYKGPISVSASSINIPSDATFKWVDTSWTSGNYFAGSGTLELMADSAKTEHTVAGSTFGGIVKLSNDSDGNQNNLKASETAAMFSNRPELIVNASSVHLGPNWNNNLEHPIQVRNLSGSGQLRGQWGSGTYNYLVETLQERDTAYTGTLGCDVSAGGNRYVNFSVIGNNPNEIHSLTITQAQNTGDNGGCRASTITVADDAKVVFTSVGKWGNGNIIVNEDGWLEATNTTAAANITLNDGSTVVVPYVNSATVPLGGTTVTLPADGTVYFDMSGVNIAGGTPVNVISATTLNNGNTASFAAKSGKWDFNVVGNTVTATKKVLSWDGSSWSDDDYSGYTEASIAVSGATSVTLPASLSLQKMTLTGSSGSLTIVGNNNTLAVGDIIVPNGVTVVTADGMEIAGDVTGGGIINVPANTTLTMDGVTTSGDTLADRVKVAVSGTLKTKGTTTLSAANTSAAGSLIEVVNGVTTLSSLTCGLSGNITIQSDGELKFAESYDASGADQGWDYLGISSSNTVKVYGKLNMSDHNLWLRANNTLELYQGAEVLGSGDYASYYGSLIWAGNASLKAYGDAEINATITTLTDCSPVFNVAENKTLTISTAFIGQAVTITKEPKRISGGSITKAGAGTLCLKNVAMTKPIHGSEGTVWLDAASAKLTNTATGSTFSGVLKLTNSGSVQNNFEPSNAACFTDDARPEFILNSTETYFNTYYNNKKFYVSNFSGTGNFKANYTTGPLTYTINTKQTKDTEFSGVFNSDGTCASCLEVVGSGSEPVHKLTLSGDNTTTNTLTVSDYVKVLFAGSGSWKNGIIKIGANGYLESSSSAATLASTLTLQDGATMSFVPDKNVTVTTLNLPSGEGETVTFDINYVPALEGTTLISSSSITANTDVGMIQCENAIIKAEEEAIKAYPVATVTDSVSGDVVPYPSVQAAIDNASALKNQYVTAYQSETVTAAGYILLKIDGDAVVTLNSSRAGYAYNDGTSYGDGIYVFSDDVQVAATFKWDPAVASGTWWTTDNWTSDDGTVSRIPGSLDTVIFESDAMVETPASGFSFAALQANASVTIKRDGYAIREGLTRTVSAYGAISGTGSLTLNDGVNLANASGASLSIGVPVTVAGATALTVAEGVAASFTGSGTLTLDALTSTSIVGDGWTGTVWLKNINSGNIVPANYGNANSVIKFTGVTGEIPTGTTCSSIIELVDDGATKALTIDFTSASAFNTITLSELKGDGTFALKSTAGYYPRTTFKISKWDAFEGSLSVDRGRIQFGNDAISNDEDYLHIRISSGASVDVATGKTWSATQGFRVYGTLNAVTPDNLTGKLVGSGRVELGSLRSSAFTFDNWTGTVVLPAISSTPNKGHRLDYYGKAGSTIEIANGFTGWLNASSDDTRNVKANVVIPENKSLIITGTNGSVTYGFAKVSGSGNLTIHQTYQPSDITIGLVEDYTGELATDDNDGGTPTVITVNKVKLASAPAAGDKLVATSTPTYVNIASGEGQGVYVGDTKQDVILEKKTDGIYVAATKSTETVDNETVTVLDTGSNMEIDATGVSGKVAIPGTVTQISGVAAENLLLKVTYTPDGVDSTTGYYAGILTLDDSGNVSLDPSGTVTIAEETVKVQPETAEDSPMTFTGSSPSFTVKAIPGLWYQVLAADSVDGGALVDPTGGTAVQATETTVSPAAPAFSGTVQYYKIAVGASKAALQ